MKVIFPNAVQHKRLSELSHDDWLQARQEGIGGSDAAAILGMNKYKSAFNVFLDKKGLSAPTEDNLNMLIGRELEDIVARLLRKKRVKKSNAVDLCTVIMKERGSLRTWTEWLSQKMQDLSAKRHPQH